MKDLSAVGAVLALALAACAPSPPISTEPDPALSLVPAGAAPTTPPQPVTDLAKLLSPGQDVTVSGQRLNADRLRGFYAPYGFAPVWTTRPWQAEALIEAIVGAADHGLAPEMFHGQTLRTSAALAPLERDLLLSDAFLAYADALARGAVPVERRRNDETLTPGPVDIPAALRTAVISPDPVAAIEALAPATPAYRALRQALRDLPRTDTARRQAIVANLERERWLPRRLPADRVWVNVPDQRLIFYRDERPALSSRVIVGRSERPNQTPELEVMIDAIWFNPPWNVPADIAANAMLPRAKADPQYLAKNNLVLLPDGGLQQRAGPYSGLASLLFDMNNRFDVYLHDTPNRELFRRDDRRISHGCVRVEEPRKLAAELMQVPLEEIDRRIAVGDTVRTPLPRPVPVFLVYQTAFADSDGKLQFRPDIYGRDAELARSLAARPTVVASLN